MVTSRMEPSSRVTRAVAALEEDGALGLDALLLVGVSGSAGAEGLISAGIFGLLPGPGSQLRQQQLVRGWRKKGKQFSKFF